MPSAQAGLFCALQAYLRKASPQIAAKKQLEPLLGVFQKLNASKALDHEAFNLLEGLTQHLWDKGLQQYMGRVSGANPPPCMAREVQGRSFLSITGCLQTAPSARRYQGGTQPGSRSCLR